MSEQTRRLLFIEPIKYNLSNDERAALDTFKTILNITRNEEHAKTLFNVSWNKDTSRSAIKIDNVINKLTDNNVLTKAQYFTEKARHSGILGSAWYIGRSKWLGIKDCLGHVLANKEPSKPNLNKESKPGWVDSLSEKKWRIPPFIGPEVNTAKTLRYLAFGMTIVGFSAAVAVTMGLLSPFGLVAISGAVTNFIGVSIGLVSGEASDRHDKNKLMNDNSTLLSDAYKIYQNSGENIKIKEEAAQSIDAILTNSMKHFQSKHREGQVITRTEKAIFSLRAACGLLGLAAPVASGLNLINGGNTLAFSEAFQKPAALASIVSSGVSLINNGADLTIKHMDHQEDVVEKSAFKQEISCKSISQSKELGGVEISKKTQKWNDDARNADSFVNKIQRGRDASRQM